MPIEPELSQAVSYVEEGDEQVCYLLDEEAQKLLHLPDHVFELLTGSDGGRPDCGHADGSACAPGERNASLTKAADGLLLPMLTTPGVAARFF